MFFGCSTLLMCRIPTPFSYSNTVHQCQGFRGKNFVVSGGTPYKATLGEG